MLQVDLENVREGLAKVNVYDMRGEAGYQAKRGGVSFALRRAADFSGQTLQAGAETISETLGASIGGIMETVLGPEIARNLGAFAGTATKSIIGIGGVGLAAAVSAGLTEVDYHHRKSNLKSLYRDELAVRFGKAAADVTVKDLEMLATENPVISEELERARKQRNFAIPLAVLATLASFAAVLIGVPALMGTSLAAMGIVGGFMVRAAVSVATYYAVKIPLQMAGGKFRGLYDETANDRIVNIRHSHEKGMVVTPEQVLSVFVKANPELDAAISQQLGKPYDAMDAEEKQRVAQVLGEQIPLAQLAQGISSGKIHATELAFAVQGLHSGVPPKEAPSGAEPKRAQQQSAKLFTEKPGISTRGPAPSHVERLNQQQNLADPTIAHS